jgi:hypothetical protein
VLATLVHLRTGLPHAALAELYGTTRSTISRATSEIRPPLATRGFAVPDGPGVRLRTLSDVFAYAETEGSRLRIDGAETQAPITGTRWAGYQAVVEYLDHRMPVRGGDSTQADMLRAERAVTQPYIGQLKAKAFATFAA